MSDEPRIWLLAKAELDGTIRPAERKEFARLVIEAYEMIGVVAPDGSSSNATGDEPSLLPGQRWFGLGQEWTITGVAGSKVFAWTRPQGIDGNGEPYGPTAMVCECFSTFVLRDWRLMPSAAEKR